MAVTTSNIARFQRWVSQYKATHGRQPPQHLMDSFLAGEIKAGQETALRREELQFRKDTAAEDLAQRKQTAKTTASAARTQGLIDVAGGIGQAALTKPGQAALKGVGAKLGIGQAATPAVGPEAITAITSGATSAIPGATGAVPGAAVQAAGGIGLPVSTTTAPATAVGAVPGASTAATAAPAATSLISTVATPLAAGALGSTVGGFIFGGEEGLIGAGRDTQRAGQIAGGIAAGALVGGPVGAVIGGIVGVASASKVICTELNRQGYIPDDILALDVAHRKQHIGDTVQAGYLSWAIPLVWLMQESWLVTQIVRPFGTAWAYEMAHRMEPDRKGRLLGRALIYIGVPICGWLGKRRAR